MSNLDDATPRDLEAELATLTLQSMTAPDPAESARLRRQAAEVKAQIKRREDEASE